jgi:PAS domain S-box-containing protein
MEPDAKALHRALFEASPDAQMLVDAAGRIVLANPAAAALLGYSVDELTCMPVDTLVPDALRTRHAAQRQAYALDPRPRPMGAQLELHARRRDASEVAVEITLNPLPQPWPAHVAVSMREADAAALPRRAPQEAGGVQALVERVMALATDDRDLIAYVDHSHIFRFVNRTFLDYWGLQRKQVEGRSAVDLAGEPAFSAGMKRRLDRALAGRSVKAHDTFNFPGRGQRLVEVAFIPARSADGAVTGVVIRMHDIQELTLLDERLRNTVALLEAKNIEQQRFIHVLSHDLREPVNTMVNFSSLLAEDCAALLPADAKRFLEFIVAAGARMKTLLDDMLRYSRIDAQPMQWQPVALDDVMADVVSDLEHTIARGAARVTWQRLPRVLGERTLIRLLLQNLVSNALKYVAPGVNPEVRVSAHVNAGRCELRVADNGIGIAAQDREAVFGLYKRLHSRREYEGSGLGLATCRRIVQMHRGRIWVDDAAAGGSCFHVELPLDSADAPASEPQGLASRY